MKTQTNEIMAAQELTNKVMMISILVLGTFLFIVSGMNFWKDTLIDKKNPLTYLDQKEYNSGNKHAGFDAIGNLNQVEQFNSQTAYILSNEEIEMATQL